MPIARNPLADEESRLQIHTVTLTPEVVETLQRLSHDASAVLGRSISASAVIRALVRRVDKHGSWATEVLFLEIEKELQEGVVWGKKK
jgi:hypothetical protein